MRLALLALAAGAGVAVCTLVAMAGAPWRGGLAAAILALGVRPARRLLGLGPDAVTRAEWRADGRWRIRGTRSAWREAELTGATSVVGPIVLLVWRERARRHHAVVTVREAGATAFRHLTGRLRLDGGGLVRGPAGSAARLDHSRTASHARTLFERASA